jgi:hypothetical protein
MKRIAHEDYDNPAGPNPAMSLVDTVISVEDLEQAQALKPAPTAEICINCWKPKGRHDTRTGRCRDNNVFEGSEIFVGE